MQKANKTLQKDCIRPLLKWYRKHARDLPWRRTSDPYAIWISEIMLQQTQVATVIPYWERWMQSLPDIPSLAAARIETILKLWEGLGYYRRARLLHQAAKEIMDHHNGMFPQDTASILSLPGIGPYTAGAIESIAFDRPRPILDGNVIRVLTRYDGIEANPKDRKTESRLWERSQEWVEQADLLRPRGPDHCSHLNQAMMELGARVCLPGSAADCTACPLKTGCTAHQTSKVAELPRLPQRRAMVQQHRLVLVATWKGQVLLQQKPAEEINGGLWEFYNAAVTPEEGKSPRETDILKSWQQSGLKGGDPQAMTTIKHTITHHRITLHCYRVEITSRSGTRHGNQKWVSLEELAGLPMPSAHQKIRRKLAKEP